jgi:hypothetical protein
MPINDTLCANIQKLVDDYIVNTLKMDYYHAMTDGVYVNKQPGLGTVKAGGQKWCNDNTDTVAIYGNGDTAYRAQSTFSYLETKALWVQSEDGGPLHAADQYVDFWSGAEKRRLPKYRNDEKSEVMTSIVVPLRQGEHVFGFLCLESKKKLPISKPAKRILRGLADGVGATLSAHEDHKRKDQCVLAAFDRLKALAAQAKAYTPFSKPTIFISSSARADAGVMGIIREVVDEVSDDFDVAYWKEDKVNGQIPARVEQVISKCRFGVCYFSEPDDSEAQASRSRDNPNVMYEAGMLESLSASPLETPKSWIPIRDFDSPQPPPFNFAQKRIIQVERVGQEKQQINADRLRADLRSTLREMISRHPIP